MRTVVARRYDGSRRNTALGQPEQARVNRLVKSGEWNDYRIRCEGPRIQVSLNGTRTVDYTEPDGQIPQSGVIGLPVHGMGKTEAPYRDMLLEELPQPYGSMSEGGRLRG